MDGLKIEKMLTAILKSQNNIHWIGGYVYGRTSNGDPFVILYPASENLEHKVCRVYQHQFKRLPDFINTADVPADTDNNPDKSKAIKRGIFHPCPIFQICTYNGKETQMGAEKRFSDVLYVSQARPERDQPQASKPEGDHWQREALTADNALMFDTAVSHLLKFFPDSKSVLKFRELLFGEFDPTRTAAILQGLIVYAAERGEAYGSQADHRRAKKKAKEAYDLKLRG